MSHISLGAAKELQSGTPRLEIFKKLMYIYAFRYKGILKVNAFMSGLGKCILHCIYWSFAFILVKYI